MTEERNRPDAWDWSSTLLVIVGVIVALGLTLPLWGPPVSAIAHAQWHTH